ncbi:hypothetical protein GTR02_19380 [Kineococcus sp. R8]|uniref:hypothetical protein n=1 Tax=Kineococcus siccus TaxID=2696567 RepID=UPI001412B45A|nr:hypothetical protein [Kineococcus siccus]NAZ83976.1 hypothetical protein [Kineococcus siccus]
MSNVLTTTSPTSARRAAPEASWVTVRDERDRPHLELRWALPGASAVEVPQATPLHHAA